MNDLLLWSLQGARRQTLSLVADLDVAAAGMRSAPGEHQPVWIVGHLLLGDTYLLSLLGAGDLSGDFAELLDRYGPRVAPSGSSADYLPVAPLAERLRSTGERRLAAIAARSPGDLGRATPDAFLARAQPTIGHHLHALVCHEGYHAGQLSAWRRTHGLGAVRWGFAP